MNPIFVKSEVPEHSQNEANMKDNLKNVLFKEDYCCLCFNTNCLKILSSSTEQTEGVTKMDQLKNIFGEKFQADLTNDLICNQCSIEMNSVYKFIENVKKSTNTMHYLINQISLKIGSIMMNIQESGTNDLENTIIIVNCPTEITTEECIRNQKSQKGNDCYKSYSQKILLVAHKNKNHSTSEFTKKCQVFKTVEAQKDHTVNHHSICPHCNKAFNDPADCVEHSSKCDKFIADSFECTDCNKSFSSQKSCSTHYFKEHLSTKKDKHKTVRSNSATLTKSVFNAEKVSRRCYLCPASFKINKDLQHHLNSKHRPDEKYYCNRCNGHYDSRLAFIRHINSYGHLRKVNPELELPFKCNECAMSFGSEPELESHTNYTHRQQRPYHCQVCGKQFAALTHLERHEARHNRERKYQCSFCDQRFTEKTGLKAHSMRFHQASMPAACELCGRTFVCLYQCRLHQQRAHAGRSYACPVCGSTFHTLGNVRVHVKKVHFKKCTLEEYMEQEGYMRELVEMFMDRRTLSKHQKQQVNEDVVVSVAEGVDSEMDGQSLEIRMDGDE